MCVRNIILIRILIYLDFTLCWDWFQLLF